MASPKNHDVTLLCYGIYALSPMYAVLPPVNSMKGMEGAPHHHVEFGILWLDLVLDSFVDGDSITNGHRCLQASQSEDIVLVKKKRAVKENDALVQPPLTVAVAIVEQELLVPALGTCDIQRDLIHSHADAYCSLSTGLSPPLFLS